MNIRDIALFINYFYLLLENYYFYSHFVVSLIPEIQLQLILYFSSVSNVWLLLLLSLLCHLLRWLRLGRRGHLLLVELLPSDVSAADVLVGASVLPLSSRYSVACVVHVRGLMDVSWVAVLGPWTTYLFQISRLLQIGSFVFCVF